MHDNAVSSRLNDTVRCFDALFPVCVCVCMRVESGSAIDSKNERITTLLPISSCSGSLEEENVMLLRSCFRDGSFT